jgi:hypothetical protein
MLQRCQTCFAVGKCPQCNGKGKVDTGLWGNVRLPCEACDASGKCPDCSGRGKKRAKPDEGTMFGALKSRQDASMGRDREIDHKILALRNAGVDPAHSRFSFLREEHGIWASKAGTLVAKPRRLLTDDSSLYDILLEDQDRSDALLDYLRALEKRMREEDKL